VCTTLTQRLQVQRERQTDSGINYENADDSEARSRESDGQYAYTVDQEARDREILTV
jgi:hypothetical protein